MYVLVCTNCGLLVLPMLQAKSGCLGEVKNLESA